MNETNELYHYGVLGMKWGIRRARKQGSSYTYRSMGQKKLERRLKKQTTAKKDAKTIQKTQNKLDLIKRRDRERQRYTENTSLAKIAAKTLVLGNWGRVSAYNRYRAAGSSRSKAYIKAYLANEYLGVGAATLISRNAEKKNAAKQFIGVD